MLCESTFRFYCCEGIQNQNCRCKSNGCYSSKWSGGVASGGEALYLGASAHLAGAAGTNWRSDVEIHSVGDEAAAVSIYKLDHGSDNSSPVSANLSLAPGRSMRLGDVLDSQFGFDGKAALMVVPSSGRVVVTSRTYNLLGDGNELGLPAGATFGQYIAATAIDEAIRFGEEGRLIQLEHSSDPDRGFRTNVGLVSAWVAPIAVKVELYTAAGELLGTVPVNLAPNEYRQINQVFARVTAGDVADGYAVVRTTTVDGVLFAFASVVDNLTGDPVAIPAVRVPNRTGPQVVVAAAHAAGAAGTNWRTDVEVHCWSGPAEYSVELLKRDTDNSSPRRRDLTIDAGTSVRHEDILSSLFGFGGAAALRITPISGEILVTSRTYNLLGEGNELGLPAGATFGQFIPSVTFGQAIQFAEEGRLIQLAHEPSGASGFRTNLVLVNAGEDRITATVDCYAADGVHLGDLSQELAPFEYRQLNRVFESVTSEVVEDGYLVVRTPNEGGAVFALASVVDNLTGDPVGMGAPILRAAASEAALAYVDGVTALVDQDFHFEDLVNLAQTVGVNGMLDAVVAGMLDGASRTGSELVLDYGAGYEPGDGSVLTGQERWDLSGLLISEEAITGRIVLDHSALMVDDEPAIASATTIAVSLQERGDGSVVGGIDLVGTTPAAKGDAVMTGYVDIDTAICVDFPVGGELVIKHNGQLITVTFEESCRGEVSHQVTTAPAGNDWDFEYRYWDPTSDDAQQHIVSTSNAVASADFYDEEYVGWSQADYGIDCVERPPGVVTYRFDFPQPLLRGLLNVENRGGAYSWDGRSGAVTVRASADGHQWHNLKECDWAADYPDVYCDYNDFLPDELLGTRELWVEVELCCRDPGGNINPPCWTAVHSYYNTSRPPNNVGTFYLLADYTP